MIAIILNIFSDFSNWGITTIVSAIFSLIVIVICLPFTYVGICLRKSFDIRFKKYKGYNIKKFEKRAIAGLLLIIIIETILYFIINKILLLIISIIILFLIILGLFNLKITFDLEEFLFGWVDDIF